MQKSKKTYHLDHAAGAPLAKEAKRAVTEYLEKGSYNPDSSHQPAVELRRELAETKSKLAKLIGVKSPNLLITSGSSDSNSKLFALIAKASPRAKIITTNIEHSTLLEAVELLPHGILNVNPQSGVLDLSKLTELIDENTVLLTIQYVNNETGIIQPIKEISRLVKKVNQARLADGNNLPLFLHTDASQAVATQDIQVPRLGVDAISLNGSKFGALPRSGVLYLSADILRWLDSKQVKLPEAKENPLSLISLYTSLKSSLDKKGGESKRLLKLAKSFDQEFRTNLPQASLNPTSLKIGKGHAPQILNYLIPNISGEKLVILAGLNGILISTGAACSASKDIPSHVLLAHGLTIDQVNSSIRISFGSANKSESEVKEAARKLASLTKGISH